MGLPPQPVIRRDCPEGSANGSDHDHGGNLVAERAICDAGSMTEPPWGDPTPPGPPPPSGYPAGYPPPYPSQYPQYPPPWPPYDPTAPFGRHPLTGQPLSDKSKTAAGLLQLLSLVGIGGIGRMYMGEVGMGVAQLLVGWFTCGVGLIWSVIDAILILTGSVHDTQGRPLRD